MTLCAWMMCECVLGETFIHMRISLGMIQDRKLWLRNGPYTPCLTWEIASSLKVISLFSPKNGNICIMLHMLLWHKPIQIFPRYISKSISILIYLAAERNQEKLGKLKLFFSKTGWEIVSIGGMNIEIPLLTSSLESDDWVASHICPRWQIALLIPTSRTKR